MRASVFVGVSVDGFLARKDGSMDFLAEEEAGPYGFEEFVATIDAHLIGRKTFEWVRGWMRRHQGRWPFEKPVFVLSRAPGRLKIPKGVRCEAIHGTPRRLLDKLARRGFRSVYVDGGKTIQGFLRAGCVDRLIVTRVPILIGAGVPLFGALTHDVRLIHVRTRTLRKRFVQSEYRVLHR
jgi:dihydrofolate reductase